MDKVSDDNDLEKIRNLLFSAQKEQMELALLIAESSGVDLQPIEDGIKKILSVAKLQPRLGQWTEAKMENLIIPLGMVLTLSIENREDIHQLPDEIGLFRNLGIIELHSVGLRELCKGIQHLKNLRSLSLKHNQLRTLPQEIGSLGRLKSLNLHDNLLDELPESMQHLSQLEVLELSKNPNLKVLPYWLVRLPSLRKLVLDKDVFQQKLPDALLPLPDNLSVEWDTIVPKF